MREPNNLSDSDFNIQIPDDFEVAILANGTPVIALLSNGNALNKTANQDHFRVLFTLRTYNTTVLPRNYLLDMTSFGLRYSTLITPQWPEQTQPQPPSGGGGAGIQAYEPYITSFFAYDRNKGQKACVKTWIHNPCSEERRVDKLKYKLEHHVPYSPYQETWEDWTPY